MQRLRLLVSAFGDPGHVFPALSLARELAADGHRVVVETWEHWRGVVDELGIEFVAAEEYVFFSRPGRERDTVQTVGEAALALFPLLDELEPDLVVADILTLAPTLAAEAQGYALATLIPHVYPVTDPEMPFFSTGARLPRTPIGKVAWRAASPIVSVGLDQGRRELNAAREQVGLGPIDRYHGGISQTCALVATFPGLEYPRRWPEGVHVTGPMSFELPHPDVELPDGDAPLVLVAPSTSQDPESHLIRWTLAALADEPVRVVATTNGHVPERPIDVPANATLHDWLSYSQVLPEAALCICHGGHGTVARALAAGVPMLTCPRAGDMAETGARLAWAGAGLSMPWRVAGPAAIRSTSRRMLSDSGFAAAAGAFSQWARDHDGARAGAGILARQPHLASRLS